MTIITGTGFIFNGSTPIGGTVTGMSHRLADGTTVIESLTGLNLALTAVKTAIDRDKLDDAAFAGHDALTGGLRGDQMSGFAGNDSLTGLRGNDLLLGGIGDDSLGGGQDSDSLIGGTGTDVAVYDCSVLSYSLPGGNTQPFDFSRIGINPSVLIDDGLGGTDTLVGMERLIFIGDHVIGDTTIATNGNDLILSGGLTYGGAGNDTLTGDGSLDTLYGGAGNDLINGNSDGGTTDLAGLTFTTSASINLSSVVFQPTFTLTVTQNGTDTLTSTDAFELAGSASADTLIASSGNDVLFGGNGSDNLQGGLGDDKIWLGDGSDANFGGTGTGIDTIRANFAGRATGVAIDFQNFAAEATFTLAEDGFGNSDSFTGMNRVRLHLTTESDTVMGSAGDDSIYGNGGNDSLSGGDGNDTLLGEYGSDTIHGGAGSDQITGFAGNDRLYADTGSASIDGGAGDDLLEGSEQDDRLFGDHDNPGGPDGIGTGTDTIFGGAGNDLIWAGRGGDRVFWRRRQ